MARTDALNITTNGSTKDKLAESYGKVIEAVQKGALSEQLKNTDYSGDPTSGSVEVNRFKNAESADYGTARTAGNGSALSNSGKVVINIDQDKEIIEEIEGKDVALFGVADIVARRVSNHAARMVATLDKAFFKALEDAGTEITTTETAIEDIAEAAIQAIETTENDWVDGVDREMIYLSLTPAMYGKLRNHIDKAMVQNDAGQEEVAMFHGVRVFSNTRQTKGIIASVFGSAAQPFLGKALNQNKQKIQSIIKQGVSSSIGKG